MSSLRRLSKAHTPAYDRSAREHASDGAPLRMQDTHLWVARFRAPSTSGGAEGANLEGWGISRRAIDLVKGSNIGHLDDPTISFGSLRLIDAIGVCRPQASSIGARKSGEPLHWPPAHG